MPRGAGTGERAHAASSVELRRERSAPQSGSAGGTRGTRAACWLPAGCRRMACGEARVAWLILEGRFDCKCRKPAGCEPAQTLTPHLHSATCPHGTRTSERALSQHTTHSASSSGSLAWLASAAGAAAGVAGGGSGCGEGTAEAGRLPLAAAAGLSAAAGACAAAARAASGGSTARPAVSRLAECAGGAAAAA